MRSLGLFCAGLLFVACGGDDSTTVNGPDSSADVTLDAPVDGSNKDVGPDAPIDSGPDVAPQACDGGVCPPAFAFRKMFLGESDRSFVLSATAWKAYGDNIDGKVTTAQSTDVCKRVQGAPSSTQVDGNNGIDNSFGSNIMPIILNVGSQTPSKTVSMSLESGSGTQLFRIDGLGSSQDYGQLGGALFKGMPFGSSPLWNGTDVRPISSQSVKNNDVNQPLSAYANGSMTARVYDSGTGVGTLALTFGAGSLLLPMHVLRIHATVAGDNSAATNGVVSGVVATTDFLAAFHQLAGSISQSLCNGSAWMSIAAQLAQASDIMQDGTQDNTKTCDGISIGLGFEASAIVLGGVQSDPVPPNPCP